MDEDIQQTTDPNDLETVQETFLVHHNNTIIGFYSSQAEADDALNGYQMANPIGIDDTLETLKVTQ